jgi:hypothetical protein
MRLIPIRMAWPMAVAAAVSCTVACGQDGQRLTAPTPVAAQSPAPDGPPPPPPPPAITRVTFSVRSGVEGLPPLAGVTIHLGDVTRVTDAQGTASFEPLPSNPFYQVSAANHLKLHGVVRSAAEQVTLWPVEAGVTARWIALSSYYGIDYNSGLWRPTRDITLDLQGDMAAEPYRSVWESAVRQVASAVESAGAGGPTIRLGSGPGAVPVRLSPSPTCNLLRWNHSTFALLPPPAIPLSSEEGARDPVATLDRVAALFGFLRRMGSEEIRPRVEGVLSVPERTALRMRVLRAPGTVFVGDDLEDATFGVAPEASDGQTCF